MTPYGSADALCRGPLPEGFHRRVVRVEPGLELAFEPSRWYDAIVLVEQGELELECRAGACRRFGRGAMIPIAQLPLRLLRNVGPGRLVLVAVSRERGPTAPLSLTD